MKQHVAKIISYGLDPSLMWPLFIILILLGTGLTDAEAQRVFMPLFLLELLAPVALLGYFHHIGKISDWEMTDVKERRLYFIYIIVLHTISFLCLYIWGNELAWQIRFIVLIIEIIGTVITFFWKVSIHLAAYTFVITSLNVLFGWQWWPLFLVIPFLMWARVVRKKHTVMQTVVGTGLAFGLMMMLLTVFDIPIVI